MNASGKINAKMWEYSLTADTRKIITIQNKKKGGSHIQNAYTTYQKASLKKKKFPTTFAEENPNDSEKNTAW